MYEVRVVANFSAAHFLKDYQGKCEEMHGHNYKVYAHVRGETLDGSGMLVDFTVLKSCLKSVCDMLDHTNLNENQYFDGNPSAERIAKFIYENLIIKLKEQKLDLSSNSPDKICLYAIDVFETDTNRARFTVGYDEQ